jgi:hypothetical protein
MNTPEKEAVSKFLRRQPEIAVSKIIGDWLFEPANRFDPNQRSRVKAEILILLSYLILMGTVFAVFNLSR